MQNEKITTQLHQHWQFRQCGTEQWYPATVPGCNFTDLIDNQLIPDPFYADNEKELQWIEREGWEYETRFHLDQGTLSSRLWQLSFAGLDTYCDIYLNGHLLGRSQNMFVPLTLQCGSLLKAGENHLHLVFHSPITQTRPLYEANGFTYPAENDKSEDRLSVYSRKAPYHFGWDWGPRFVTSGIWRPVALEGVKHAHISDVHSQIDNIAEDKAQVTFTTEIAVVDSLQEPLLAVELSNEDGDVLTCQLPAGSHSVTHTITIENPRLWWPNGLGEPHLYRFNVKLVLLDDNDERCLDTVSRRVGLRTIEMVNQEDEHGLSFYFKVNGHPVFMKGANYIPDDSFLNRVTPERHKQTFSDAVAANMNMLRVWGGGIYQDDEFYHLADEHGILIWQDFMFACTLYPADDAFLDNVKQEAIANIKRLRNHPSLAMWCGNNEVEMGIQDWGWPEKFGYSEPLQAKLLDDYRKLFHDLLPRLVSQLDGERFYLPSSPIGHWEHPEQDSKGNHHYWGVWHGEEPFSEYRRRIPRFMSEYGFQSFPLLQYVKEYIPQLQWQLESEAMKVHQKHPRGNALIKKYMLDEYREPKDFASLLYLSQVQQAWGLKQAFDAHRRHKPYCMGTIYWQFNDCWPVASWSGRDHTGRWKALHYQAKRSFVPILPVVELDGDQVDVFVVNDLLTSQSCQLEWVLLSLDGEVLTRGHSALSLSSNSSESVLQLSKLALLNGVDVSRCVLSVSIKDDRHQWLASDNRYFVENKHLALAKPNVDVTCSFTEQWNLTLTSATLVKDLHIDVSGINGNISDNFFDLLPGQTKVVQLPNSEEFNHLSECELQDKLTLMSVFDTYSQEI